MKTNSRNNLCYSKIFDAWHIFGSSIYVLTLNVEMQKHFWKNHEKIIKYCPCVLEDKNIKNLSCSAHISEICHFHVNLSKIVLYPNLWMWAYIWMNYSSANFDNFFGYGSADFKMAYMFPRKMLFSTVYSPYLVSCLGRFTFLYCTQILKHLLLSKVVFLNIFRILSLLLHCRSWM